MSTFPFNSSILVGGVRAWMSKVDPLCFKIVFKWSEFTNPDTLHTFDFVVILIFN